MPEKIPLSAASGSGADEPMTHLHIFLLLFAALALVILFRLPRKKVHLNHAVGVKTLAGRFTELIPKGVELPFVFSDRFHNAVDFQDDMMIELMQQADGVLRRLDLITLDHLPLKPMGMMDVEIRLVVSKKKKMYMTVQSAEARVLKTFGPYLLDG